MAQDFKKDISCSVCPVKGDRKSIVTIISDDGEIETSYHLARLAAKHDFNISIASTTVNLKQNLAHWQMLEKIFPIEILNHTFKHRRLDTPGLSIAEVQHGILESAQFIIRNFRSPAFSFIPPNNQLTEDAWRILSENGFLAVRSWHRGLNSIHTRRGTAPGEWFNLRCRGIGDTDWDVDADLESMRHEPAWLIEMWHNVYTDKPANYQPIHINAAREHIGKLAQHSHIWLAGFNEAVSYIWQRDNVSPRAFFHDGTLHLKLDARNPYLPWPKFTSALTVKVGGFPRSDWRVISGIEDFEVRDDGTILVDIFPEQHGQLQCLQ